MPENSKTIKESCVTLSVIMGPQDTNGLGNVHGGVIMKLVDEAGALAAMRHAGAPVVTVVVDSMTFMEPIYVGNFVMFNAALTYVGRTSMEVRVEVIAENPLTGDQRMSNTAYLVYVALESGGIPTAVPALEYENAKQEHEAELAKQRQAYRKEQRNLEAARRSNA